jgi:hypothetical protein
MSVCVCEHVLTSASSHPVYFTISSWQHPYFVVGVVIVIIIGSTALGGPWPPHLGGHWVKL